MVYARAPESSIGEDVCVRLHLGLSQLLSLHFKRGGSPCENALDSGRRIWSFQGSILYFMTQSGWVFLRPSHVLETRQQADGNANSDCHLISKMENSICMIHDIA